MATLKELVLNSTEILVYVERLPEVSLVIEYLWNSHPAAVSVIVTCGAMSKPGVVRIVPRSPNSGHLVPKVVNMTSVGTPVPSNNGISGQSFPRVITSPSYVVNGLQTSGSGHFLHRAPVAPVRVPAPPAPAPVVSGPRHLRQPSVTYTVVGPPRAMPTTVTASTTLTASTTVTATNAVAAPMMVTMSPKKLPPPPTVAPGPPAAVAAPGSSKRTSPFANMEFSQLAEEKEDENMNCLRAFWQEALAEPMISTLLASSEHIDKNMYWEKRRIQNHLRRLLEEIQERLGIEMEATPQDLDGFFNKLLQMATKGSLHAVGRLSLSLDEARELTEKDLSKLLEGMNLWPMELAAVDRNEVLAALQAPSAGTTKQILRNERPIKTGPNTLTAHTFRAAFEQVPYNLPEFPVPVADTQETNMCLGDLLRLNGNHRLGTAQLTPGGASASPVDGKIRTSRGDLWEAGNPTEAHMIEKAFLGPYTEAQHQAVAEAIATCWRYPQTGVDRIKDFFCTGLVSIEECDGDEPPKMARDQHDEIQCGLPRLIPRTLVEDAVALIIRKAAPQFTQQAWDSLVVEMLKDRGRGRGT
eukprot:s686_g5.t1